MLNLSTENKTAIRSAIATLIAILLAFAFHFDKPYWAGMTVVILANIYTGNIIDKAIMRISGALIGAWLGLIVAHFVANSFFLYLFSCFLIVAIAVYYYNISNYAYAYLLGALSAFIVISELAFDTEASFYIAIWRPLEIGLGVLVSAAAAFCIFPNPIHRLIKQQSKELLEDFSQLLNLFQLELTQNSREMEDELKSRLLAMKKKLKKTTEMLENMRREVGFKRIKLEQLQLLTESLYRLGRLLNYLMNQLEERDITSFKANSLLQKNAQQFNALIQEDLKILIELYYEEVEYPQYQPKALDFIHQFNPLKEENWKQTQDKTFILLLYEFFEYLAKTIQGLYEFTQIPPNSALQLISRAQRLRTDTDIIKHSIKAGLAAMLALVFWLTTNWPGGLNGIISSIVISIRKHLDEMRHISMQRVLGCFLGGSLALGSLALFAFNLYDFILLILVGVWLFSYFAFKYTEHAYIGLQANLALIIALAQEGGPPIFLAPPLQRLGGVIIGIASSFLVANILWRRDLFSVLSSRLNKLNYFINKNWQNYIAGRGIKVHFYDLHSLFVLNREILEYLQQQQEHLSSSKRIVLHKSETKFEQLIISHISLNFLLELVSISELLPIAEQYHIDILNLLEHIQSVLQKKDMSQLKELAGQCDYLLQQLLQEDIKTFSINKLIIFLYIMQQFLDSSIKNHF